MIVIHIYVNEFYDLSVMDLRRGFKPTLAVGVLS